MSSFSAPEQSRKKAFPDVPGTSLVWPAMGAASSKNKAIGQRFFMRELSH
jgi:hypothetical protein